MGVILLVIILLNTYPVWLMQQVVFEHKYNSMLSDAGFCASELGASGISPEYVPWVIDVLSVNFEQNDNITVYDKSCKVIYSTVDTKTANEDINTALSGTRVFRSAYKNTAFDSEITVPIFSDNVVVGALFVSQIDKTQGSMLEELRTNILIVSIVIFVAGILFSFLFSISLTRRISLILKTIKKLSNGDYLAIPVGGRDELAVVEKNLNELAAIIKENEALRRQFVSNASHELKTPLTSMKLLIDNVLQTPDTPREMLLEYFGDIGDETERLYRLTEKLMTLSKLETIATTPELISPANTIERVLHSLRPVAKNAEVSLIKQIEDVSIMGNNDSLHQIIFNLVDNAIKYNHKNGSVTVGCRKQNKNAVIFVSDTGIGIPKEELQFVFDRFYRVDKSRSQASAGLGLSIVAQTVKNLGGEISVESEEGKGTTFSVTFPLVQKN